MVPRLVYPLEVSAVVRYRVHPKRGSQKVHTYFSFTHKSEGKKTKADLKFLYAKVQTLLSDFRSASFRL